MVPGPLQLKAPPAQDDLLSFPLEGPLTSALPTHPGGLGGTLVGTGQGPGEGWGDGSGQGTGGKGILKLLKAERPRWGIRPGDRPKNGDRVQVRLLVGTNGVPFRALPVSGRASLYPAVIRAGLKWRFTVPTGYERFAPFEVTVDFTYRTGDTSSSQVKELQPVEVR